MAERDLDRYLEGIGIDVDGDESQDRPLDDASEDVSATTAEDDAQREANRVTDRSAARDHDRPGEGAATLPKSAANDDDDFEQAMAGMSVGGIVPDDLSVDERAESFLVQLLLYLDPTYAVDVGFDDEGGVDVDIHGGDPGRLIGKGGRTLAALEFLTNAVVNKAEGDAPVRVSVDVGGYKRRRDERLRQTAQRAAARARKSGMPVELDPMSAAERRVVHVELA